MTVTGPHHLAHLTVRDVTSTWAPLALSWLIMTSELVITTAFVARMAQAELNLAAWGIVFAISVIVQSPAQMLLPLGTALTSDAAAYAKLRRYAMHLLVYLTLLQLIVGSTPLYGAVMRAIGAPQDVIEIGRIGVLLMAPYAFCTGFRRFQQGVLIRYGDATVVVWGSVLRVVSVTVVLAGAMSSGAVSGVAAAAAAIVCGVAAEALYTQMRVVPIITGPLKLQRAVQEMTFGRFYRFVWPLVVMNLLTMLVQSFVAVALARLARPLESLAVWPVLWGFLMLWQSPGMSYTEVVISLVRRPGAVRLLRRITTVTAAGLFVALFIVALTPLSPYWFATVSGLDPKLTELATRALLVSALLPSIRVIIGWYQGVIMYSEQTRAIMESVVVFLVVGAAGLAIGGALIKVAGIYVGSGAFVLAFAAQAAWLGHRCGPLLRATSLGGR